MEIDKNVSKQSFFTIKYLLFLGLLYVFIYNPPLAVLPFTPKYFLYAIIPFILVFKNKLFMQFLGKVKYIFLLLCLIIIYSFFRELFQLEIVFLPLQISLLIEILILPICFIILYKQIKPEGDFLNELILLGTIASVITVILILNPSLNDFIKFSVLRTTEYTEFVAGRAFGFSEGLTFSYGTVQGLILAIILFKAGKKSLYYFLVPLFFVSVLFNSRTGFTPVVVALFLSVLVNFKIKKILIFAIIFFAFSYLYNSTTLFEEYKKTIEWGLDFFVQSSEFLSNKSSDTNTFSTLFNDMAIYPNTIAEWIFGTGENIFINPLQSSDVGYIIQLYYGGLFYLFLIFLLIFAIVKDIKNVFGIYRNLFAVIIVCIILFNVKGNLFTPVGILRLIMILYIYMITTNSYRKKVLIGNQNNNLTA